MVRLPHVCLALCASLGVVLFSAPAFSAPILTQDLAAFNAATAGLSFTFQGFEDVPPNNLTPLGTSRNYTDFTITNPQGMVSVSLAGFCDTGLCIADLNDGGDFTFQFDAPLRAMGFFVGDLDGLLAQVFVNGALIGSVTSPNLGLSFVGIYDLIGSFNQVVLNGPVGTQSHTVDSVRFAAAAVPEPATLTLLGLGTLGLARTWRRRQHAK